MMDVSIIIIATNERDLVAQSLKSIFDRNINCRYEVLVVDNASSDGLLEMVQSYYPDVNYIRRDEKRGFIENNNLAIKKSTGRYVLLLNPDTILSPSVLDTMVHFMDSHPETAVSSCKLVFPDSSLQYTCRSFPTPLTYLFRWLQIDRFWPRNPVTTRYLYKDWDHNSIRFVDWVITAFFFMNHKAIEEIGLLDEGFKSPFYCEDLDWCYRAKCSGRQVYYIPTVTTVHIYQQESSRRLNHLTFVHLYNIFRLFKKHGLFYWRRVPR